MKILSFENYKWETVKEHLKVNYFADANVRRWYGVVTLPVPTLYVHSCERMRILFCNAKVRPNIYRFSYTHNFMLKFYSVVDYLIQTNNHDYSI